MHVQRSGSTKSQNDDFETAVVLRHFLELTQTYGDLESLDHVEYSFAMHTA